MQQTIQLGQVQPSVLSNAERTVKNWREELSVNVAAWMATRNEWFSAFTGYMVALVGALLLAGWLEGGAL